MSQGNGFLKVTVSPATRAIADNLIAAVQAEADPRVSKGTLVRIATLEAALAAFRHVDEIDRTDALCAIVDSTIMLARAFATVTGEHPDAIVGAIMLGMAERADIETLTYKPHSGPKKEAS